jgi:hypothetical protein
MSRGHVDPQWRPPEREDTTARPSFVPWGGPSADVFDVVEPRFASAGGADRVRTGDLRLARAALSQLSYSPGGSWGWWA